MWRGASENRDGHLMPCHVAQVYGKLDSKPLATVTIQCDPPLGDLGALITICSKPCFEDPHQKCCFVPLQIAGFFSCCRSRGCCPDDKASQTRRRAQGVAVGGPSITVEATEGAVVRMDGLLACLNSPSEALGDCTRRYGAPRRLFSSIPITSCKNGGVLVPGTRGCIVRLVARRPIACACARASAAALRS